jgi:ribosome-binding protein aMBF1 (putative translation factor)
MFRELAESPPLTNFPQHAHWRPAGYEWSAAQSQRIICLFRNLEMKKIEKPNALARAISAQQWKESEGYKKANRSWLKKSADIALRVLDILDEKRMSQNDLAGKLKVTRQQVSKMLKGQENLTLETISKLEEVLGIGLVKVLNEKEGTAVSHCLRRQSNLKRKGLIA